MWHKHLRLLALVSFTALCSVDAQAAATCTDIGGGMMECTTCVPDGMGGQTCTSTVGPLDPAQVPELEDYAAMLFLAVALFMGWRIRRAANPAA